MTKQEYSKLPIKARQNLLVTAISLLAKDENERDRLLLHLSFGKCERCLAMFIEYFETFLERSEVVHLNNRASTAIMN